MMDATRKNLILLIPIVLSLATIVIVVLVDADRPPPGTAPPVNEAARLDIGGPASALKSNPSLDGGARTGPASDPAAGTLTAAPADDWLTGRTLKAVIAPSAEKTARGRKVLQRNACLTCHRLPDGSGSPQGIALAGWRDRRGTIYNSDMFERFLAQRLSRKGTATARAVERIRRAPRGPARLAVWLDEMLNDPAFDKPRDYRPPAGILPMPPYQQIQGADREDLMAFLFAL